MTPTPPALELAQRLRLEVDRLRRAVRARRTLAGLPRRQEAALSWIRRRGPLSTADLARHEQVRPQSMSATVGDLVAAGLVARRPDPDDGRRELLDLTERGRAVLADAAAQRDHDLAALIDATFTAAERRRLGATLDLLDRITGDAE